MRARSTEITTCPFDAQRLGHPPGSLKLEPVSLAIIDRQGVEGKALLPGDGRRRRRVEPPGKEDHRRSVRLVCRRCRHIQ